jgi:hypothetical protein
MAENIGFRFPGGKQDLARQITKYIPRRGRKCVDLFAGRANITLCAMHQGYEYEEWIVNDIRQYQFLCALRDFGDRIHVPDKTVAEYKRLEALPRDNPESLLLAPLFTFNGGGWEAGGMTTEGGIRRPESYERNLRGGHRLFNTHNLKITNLDWFDCLDAEQPGPDDAIAADPPYINCNQTAYKSEDICPTELIECLQSASFNWVFCEYYQPLYRVAFGEPVFRKSMQLRSTNFKETGGQERRVECIWTNQRAK